MEPHHHHEHNHQLTSLNKAFIIGITLNIAFVIVEFGVGFYYNSLGLLSDAGHNLGDVPVWCLLCWLSGCRKFIPIAVTRMDIRRVRFLSLY